MRKMKDFLLTVTDCIIYSCYLCISYLIYVLQLIVRNRQKRGDTSCRVYNIIWKKKLLTIDVVSPSDFVGLYEKSVKPEYVLGREVSLYCVTKYEAIFVELPKDVDIYSSKVNPFLYIAQFQRATKTIRMPIESFHALAYKIGHPKIQVSFLANTGRCGSTILSQCLETVPGMLVQSEPDSLTNIQRMNSDKSVTKQDIEDIFISTINILCKPVSGISSICIKPRSCGTQHCETIARVYPDIKIVFLYRNTLSNLSSLLGLMASGRLLRTLEHVTDSGFWSKIVPLFRKQLHENFRIFDTIGEKVLKLEYNNLNSVQVFAMMLASCITLVKNLKKSGFPVMVITYEDLVKNKKEECARMFRNLNISEEQLEVALLVFEKDSQQSSPLARTNIASNKKRQLSEIDKHMASQIFLRFGLPCIGKEIVI